MAHPNGRKPPNPYKFNQARYQKAKSGSRGPTLTLTHVKVIFGAIIVIALLWRLMTA